VYVEATSKELGDALGREENPHVWSSGRGFSHLIASDPASLTLQRRARPVFFLNGRVDGSGGESATLSERSAMRRRLNMIGQLRDLEPKRLVIVGTNPAVAIEELADLWQGDFRALLTVVSADTDRSEEIAEILAAATDLGGVQWIRQSTQDFAQELLQRLESVANGSKLLLKVRLSTGAALDVDFARAELAEHPIGDACEFIQVRDTLPVSPQDLTQEEFRNFFTRSEPTWRAYAAGLPWIPNLSAETALLQGLNKLLGDPPTAVQLYSISAEPGAGGTTQARALAFAAARAGFPTLLIKQHSDVPSSLEITSFFYRALSVVQDAAGHHEGGAGIEPVWLLVLDVQHLDGGTDDLWRLCTELARSGRRAAVLKVVAAENPLQPPKHIPHKELVYVNHELDLDSAVSLGRHLNVFLRLMGEEKKPDQWRSFWEMHRPDIDTGIASFWIALEFWLAGSLKLGESIQGWALRQFKELEASTEVKRSILEIAALSVERRALPERLLATLKSPRLPWSQVLEEARRHSPGLGLVQAQSVPYGRVWAIAHDVLARYLLNAVWNDRIFAGSLGVDRTEDPVALRIELIKNIGSRSSIGDAFAKPFAVNLATQVLKLDEHFGNAEFFPYWRRILGLLEAVPKSVINGSRTFNHHLAISRRRVTQGELFNVTPLEKRGMLTKAVAEVTFALEKIDPNADDEGDLNLLNTLALLYQDLATLQRIAFNDKDLLAHYLAKSDEVTKRALKENPNNSYVLETAAKNLLRQHFDPEDQTGKLEAAAEALSYVFQASNLESAVTRRMSLGQLADEALDCLRAPTAEAVVDRLCGLGSAYGFIAKAWRSLPQARESTVGLLEHIGKDEAKTALEILRQAPERDWLLVRLQYDLEAIASPFDFGRQLSLLDELANTAGYRLSMQQRLERAVLLHFQGRHKAGGDEFSKVRRDIKTSQSILFVPDRLRWLLSPDRSRRATCSARAIDSSSGRPLAHVTELGGIQAPYTAQEFGKARFAAGELFKCQVTFSAMGPFLKPAEIQYR
jgi:tetratricopeptide (TPR) repeat protein